RSGEDLLRGAHLGDDPAGPEDHHPVPEQEGLVDVVGDEDDRLAQVALQVLQLLLELAAHERAARADRFVQRQDVLVRGEPAGHPDALLLAAGELSGVAVGECGVQAHGLHQLMGALARLALGGAAQHGHGGDVVQHGAVREESVGLHDVVDAAAEPHRVQARDVVAVDVDAPGGGSTMRLIIRIRVVLPEPEEPTITTDSWEAISRLKSSTASVPPGYSLRTFSNPITGPPDGASWGTGPADRDHGPGADLSEPRNAGRRPSLARRGDGAAAGHP